MKSAGDRQDDLERQVVEVLLGALSGQGWSSAELFWSMVGPSTTSEVTFVSEIGVGLDYVPTPKQLHGVLRRLKAAMSEPERGTWFSVRLMMQRDGTYEFVYDGHREVFWLSDDPYEEMDNTEPSPQDSEWQAELLRYPRTVEHLPSWLLDRSVLVTVDPPPDYSAVFGGPPWAEMWSDIPRAVGCRLCTPSYWPHGRAALQAEVTADLLQTARSRTGFVPLLAEALRSASVPSPCRVDSTDDGEPQAQLNTDAELLTQQFLENLVGYYLTRAKLVAYVNEATSLTAS